MKRDLFQSYDHLSADERFRLAVAANDRGDGAEVQRLSATGPRAALDGPEHAPHLMSFMSLSDRVFMELIEQASLFHDAFDAACRSNEEPSEEEVIPKCWERVFHFGCLLRTKYFGWVRFCKGIGVPPHWQWCDLPGFWRLKLAMTMSKEKSFKPIGYMRYLNRRLPEGCAPMTKPPLTTKRVAREFYRIYRKGIPS